MNTDDSRDKVRKKIVKILNDEVVPKYNRILKDGLVNRHKPPSFHKPNYVSRMYRQIKEGSEWE